MLDALKIGIEREQGTGRLLVNTGSFLVFLDYALPYVDVGRAAERLGPGPTMTVERTIEFLDVLKVGIEPTPLFQRVSTYVDVGSFLAALDELGIALPRLSIPLRPPLRARGVTGGSSGMSVATSARSTGAAVYASTPITSSGRLEPPERPSGDLDADPARSRRRSGA